MTAAPTISRLDIGIDSVPAETVLVYTLLNPISLLLKQFDELTSGTSFGSAKVMSMHCIIPSQLSASSKLPVVSDDGLRKMTYVIEGSTMDCRLDNLDGGIVSHIEGRVCR